MKKYLIYLIILLVSCSAYSENVFSKIINKKLISNTLHNKLTFNFTQENVKNKIYYVNVSYNFPDDSYATITIEVTKHGLLLSKEKYMKQREKISKLNKKWLELFFPDIGKMAVYGFALGPNGGGDGITFTTKDEKYDIKIDQSSHMNKDFSLDLSTISLAVVIEKKYNIMTGKKNER